MTLAERDRRIKAKHVHETACAALGIKPISYRHRFECDECGSVWTLLLPIDCSGTIDRCPKCGNETPPHAADPVYPPMAKEPT